MQGAGVPRDRPELLTRIANLPGLDGLCARIVQLMAAAAGGETINTELIRRVCRGLHGREFATGGIERAVKQSRIKVA